MNDRNDMSEYATVPARVIVHDPTAFSAFSGFREERVGAGVDPTGYLFREVPDMDLLAKQHAHFVSILGEHVPVSTMADLVPEEHRESANASFRRNPNFLFTHDALITIPWAPGVWIRGSMRESIRRMEVSVIETVAATLSLREVTIDGGSFLEGGDVIPLVANARRLLLIGFGPRTDAASLHAVYRSLSAMDLIDEVIGCELAPWRLNLDGCLFPVSPELVVLHRASVVGGMRIREAGVSPVDPAAYLEGLGFRMIDASRQESFDMQACNFFCAGDNTFVAYGMTQRINDELREEGLTVRSFEGSELVKGSGGPHCMTRPIYANGV